MPLSRALNPSLLGTTVRTAAVLAHRPHTELNMKTDVSGRIRKTEPRPSGRIDVKQQRDINWHFNLDLKRKQLKLKLGTSICSCAAAQKIVMMSVCGDVFLLIDQFTRT